MTVDKLKPCPFCGGEGKQMAHNRVVCLQCGASSGHIDKGGPGFLPWLGPEAGKRDWNTRAALEAKPAATQREVERYKHRGALNTKETREEWRPVFGHEGHYMVSSLGRVFSLGAGRVMAQYLTERGYLKVELSISGKPTRRFAHRLVAEAFIGPCPPGITVNHIDGVKTNNTIRNLEYLTREENIAHFSAARPRGVKLTRIQAEEIRSLKELLPTKTIAKRFGVSRQTVNSILSGQSWS